MQVTIDIPDSAIIAVVRKYGEAAFEKLERGYDKPAGYVLIQQAVAESIKTIDFRALVEPIMLEIARNTTPEVVREILLKELKAVAKELRNDGTLFQAMKGEGPSL